MRRRWWDRLAFWRRIWDWCPECERNGVERAEAVNQVIYWRSLYDDSSVVSYARGLLVDVLLRRGVETGAWCREDLERVAVAIETADPAGGPPTHIRREAANLLRLSASIAPHLDRWECRACGGTTRAVHEDQSVSCDDCGRLEGDA